ncbi:MAG: hypothetical protein D6678_08300 [Zetaproteobacteria bacterium]|nr:MAG: hypothetical protein D6678_08300 [Zetaproteobacteria bacterium]
MDIAPFSRNGEPELLLPCNTRFQVLDIWREKDDTVVVKLRETADRRPLGRNRRFSAGGSS